MHEDITNGLLMMLGEYIVIDANGCWLWEGGRDYGMLHITDPTTALVEVVPGVDASAVRATLARFRGESGPEGRAET